MTDKMEIAEDLTTCKGFGDLCFNCSISYSNDTFQDRTLNTHYYVSAPVTKTDTGYRIKAFYPMYDPEFIHNNVIRGDYIYFMYTLRISKGNILFMTSHHVDPRSMITKAEDDFVTINVNTYLRHFARDHDLYSTVATFKKHKNSGLLLSETCIDISHEVGDKWFDAAIKYHNVFINGPGK